MHKLQTRRIVGKPTRRRARLYASPGRPACSRAVRRGAAAAARAKDAGELTLSSAAGGLVEGKSVSKQVEPNQRPRILRAGALRRASRAARGEEHYCAAADESLS